MNSIRHIKSKITFERVSNILLVIILVGMVVSSVIFKGESVLEDIKITMLDDAKTRNLIYEEEVKDILVKNFDNQLIGRKLKEVDVQLIEEVLDMNPFIKEADVYISATNVLHIRIDQRKPMLRLVDTRGVNFYMDEEGYRLPLSKNYTCRVPVVTGYIPVPEYVYLFNNEDIFQQLYTLGKAIREDDFIRALIEQIDVNVRNEITLIPKLGTAKIIFGEIEDVDNKFFKLKRYYKKGLPYAGWDKYKSINLSYDNLVFCKRA